MTLADLRENLERQMIISRVQQNEVLGKIAVSEDEAREYYDAHIERVHDARRRSRCARSSSPFRATRNG